MVVSLAVVAAGCAGSSEPEGTDSAVAVESDVGAAPVTSSTVVVGEVSSTTVAPTVTESPNDRRVREAREVVDAEIAAGEWAAELGALPAKPFVVIELVDRLGVVSLDGEPLGWLAGDFGALREVNVPVPVWSLDPDVDVSVAVGAECTFGARSGTDDLYLCADPEIDGSWASRIVRHSGSGALEAIAGPAWGPYEGAAGPTVVGHWSWIAPFDDTILGQWSGECEVPTAHVIAGGVWSVAIDDDGAARLVPKSEAEHDAVVVPASVALGWTGDGRALIHVMSGACSSSAPDGLYIVDPATAEVDLLVSIAPNRGAVLVME